MAIIGNPSTPATLQHGLDLNAHMVYLENAVSATRKDVEDWYDGIHTIFAHNPEGFVQWEKANPVYATKFHALANTGKRPTNATNWGGEYDHKTRARQLGKLISDERGFGPDGKHNGRAIATDFKTFNDVNNEFGPGDFYKIGNASTFTNGFTDFIKDNPIGFIGGVALAAFAPAIIGAVAPGLTGAGAAAAAGGLTGAGSSAINGGDLGDIVEGGLLGGAVAGVGGLLTQGLENFAGTGNPFVPTDPLVGPPISGMGSGAVPPSPAWGMPGHGQPTGALNFGGSSSVPLAGGADAGYGLLDPILSEIPSFGGDLAREFIDPINNNDFNDANNNAGYTAAQDIVWEADTGGAIQVPNYVLPPTDNAGGGGGGGAAGGGGGDDGTQEDSQPTQIWRRPNQLEPGRAGGPTQQHTNPDGSVVEYDELGQAWEVSGPVREQNQDINTNWMLANGLRTPSTTGVRRPAETSSLWGDGVANVAPPSTGTGGGGGFGWEDVYNGDQGQSGGGSGTGAGSGSGSGSGDGDGDGRGDGTGLGSANAFSPTKTPTKENDLFDYTKLSPSAAAALGPYIDHLTGQYS